MLASAGNELISDVRVTDDELVVALADGRTLSVPLAWYPSLLNASAEERRDWELIGDGEGVHWPQIDEDLSAAGLLRGVPAHPSRPPRSRTDEVEERYLLQAQEFFGQSMGRIKGQMQSDRAQLQSFMQQLPPEAQAQIQGMVDSYTQFVGVIDQAAQDAGVQEVTDQATQEAASQAQETAGQVAGQAQQAAGQVTDQSGQVVGQVQDATGQSVGQVQDIAGQVTNQAGYQPQLSRRPGTT